MKPLRIRLQEQRERVGLPWEVLERDYIISWVLAGIASVPSLKETLVFKGGTALRKCYFDDYRFSEDLDFTGVGGVHGRETITTSGGYWGPLMSGWTGRIFRLSCARKVHEIRGVTFEGEEDFFPEALLQQVRKTWESGLGPLVAGLPPYETVLSQVRPWISAILTSSGAG